MIDITTLVKLQEKHTHACNKHNWSGYQPHQMKQVLFEELIELYDAYFENRIDGAHGVIDEAYDVISVLLRIIESFKTD